MIFNFDPIALQVGAVEIRWYSLFFSIALVGCFFLMEYFFKRDGRADSFSCFLPYGFFGAILGARLGHFLFYAPSLLLEDPWVWLKLTQVAGMSSHGGFFGLVIAFYLCAKNCKAIGFLWLCERACLALLFIGVFVRLGNFFNLEILGEPTSLPWGMVFPAAGQQPRHPVQLYESLSYLLMFLIFFRLYIKTSFADGALLWKMLLAFSSVRFSLEFLKESQSEYWHDLALNSGQLLTLPIFVAAIGVYSYLRRKDRNS
jgi:phosphatidylglycerol:prolipoprotein diacylglycerol transferase